MAAKEAVSILGITATADEWTAWSAIGTVAAAVIAVTALLLPLYGAWRRRRIESREARQTNQVITNLTDGALRTTKFILRKYETPTSNHSSLMGVAAMARYTSQTLRILAKKQNAYVLGTQSALGAAEMLDLIVIAETKMRQGDTKGAISEMRIIQAVEVSVKTMVDGLAKEHGMMRLPDAYFEKFGIGGDK